MVEGRASKERFFWITAIMHSCSSVGTVAVYKGEGQGGGEEEERKGKKGKREMEEVKGGVGNGKWRETEE